MFLIFVKFHPFFFFLFFLDDRKTGTRDWTRMERRQIPSWRNSRSFPDLETTRNIDRLAAFGRGIWHAHTRRWLARKKKKKKENNDASKPYRGRPESRTYNMMVDGNRPRLIFADDDTDGSSLTFSPVFVTHFSTSHPTIAPVPTAARISNI